MPDSNQALEVVKKRNPKCSSFRVAGEYTNFLNGSLVIIDYKDEDDEPDEEAVFWTQTEPLVILEAEHLARKVARHYPSTLRRWIMGPTSFAGVIALIITVTVGIMVVAHGSDVPHALSAPLGAIVGFYFGRFAGGVDGRSKQIAIEAVRAGHQKARKIGVQGVVRDFLDGELVVINCKTPSGHWESYVYIDGRDVVVYDSLESVVSLVATYKPPPLFRLVTSVTTFGGLVAIGICLALCLAVAFSWSASVVHDGAPVVHDTEQFQTLSNVLTSIVGFYFGATDRGH